MMRAPARHSSIPFLVHITLKLGSGICLSPPRDGISQHNWRQSSERDHRKTRSGEKLSKPSTRSRRQRGLGSA